MWNCSKCNREFSRFNQQHSCVVYPIENHFKDKEAIAKPLFDELVSQIEKNIGSIKIESLPCCIHLVSNYTFGAVWAMKNKIRIDFRLDSKIDDPMIVRMEKMSANRYLYYLDIADKNDIDDKLIGWLKTAYGLSHS